MDDRLKWLDWAQQLQALAQSGLAYDSHPYHAERYALVLKIAAEIASSQSLTDFAQVRDLFIGDIGHATPKVDVRGVMFQGNRVLLVKEHSDGRWTLPGGWADVGESAAEAVVREVREEAGYPVRADKLLAVYDRSRHGHPPHPWYIYKLFFLCTVTGDPTHDAHNTEIDAVDFFPVDDLPELSLGRTTPAEIARFFEHVQHPDWPTDFD